MIIDNFRREESLESTRILASVTWEDCNIKSRDVYFETSKEFSGSLTLSPHAFLVGSILPAMYNGEKRIKVDGKICPMLEEGLLTNMEFFRSWYGADYTRPVIETKGFINKYTDENESKKVGLFLSGGVDSLFALRMNRLKYPLEHPASINDGIIVHGFDIYHDEKEQERFSFFNTILNSLKEIKEEANITLIPVYTNIRHLFSDVEFWIKWFHGAALASVAHGFSKRYHTILIAATHYLANLHPHGSHPLIDHNYSCANIRMIHDNVRFCRFEKIKTISEWPTALKNLRVCANVKHELLNCGKCEKCIRTMLALIAIGKLTESATFPYSDIAPDKLRAILRTVTPTVALFYNQLVQPLKNINREDLARVIEQELGLFGRVRKKYTDAKKVLKIIIENN